MTDDLKAGCQETRPLKFAQQTSLRKMRAFPVKNICFFLLHIVL